MGEKASVNNESAQSIRTAAEALQDIVTWSTSRPLWQRDALRRLCQKGSLDKTDYVALLEICEEERDAVPIASEHVSAPKAASSHVYLHSIHSVEHVNALAPRQEVRFEKGNGITVIYGDNGSGKSGYARILKSACRARVNKELNILSNIYETSSETPKAKIDFAVNDEERSAEWVFNTPCDSLLSAVSVFDSATANIHVYEKNDLAYTPYPLKLLKHLSDAVEEINSRLSLEVQTLENQIPPSLKIPEYYNEGTQVHQVISQLNAKADISKITALATISAEEENSYKTLKADLANNPEGAAQKLGKKKNKLEQLTPEFKIFCAAVTDEHFTQAQALYKDSIVKKAAATAAADERFHDEKLSQIGSEIWHVLWEAARKYSEKVVYPNTEFSNTEFPYTGAEARCVLCHQELSEEAAKRLRSFECFVQDATKQQETAAQSALNATVKALKKKVPSLKSLKEAISFIADELEEQDVADELRKVVLQGKWRIRAFLNRLDGDINSLPPYRSYPDASVDKIQTELHSRITTLAAERNSETRKQAEKKLLELEDRKWLATVKDDVIAHVDRITRIKALNELKKANKTKSITNKSSELALYLVNDALRAQFSKEVAKFELGKHTVELRYHGSRKGSPVFKVEFKRNPNNEKVNAILSEGEFRCVALAAFLAEQATTASKSTVVFDDPVCSLDHTNCKQIADRLAEEAKNRQIVIFTHDLSFLYLLREACEHNGASIVDRGVSRNDTNTGVYKDNAPLKAQGASDAVDSMEKRLNNVKKFYANDGMEEWEVHVCHFSGKLRSLWESIVENVLSPVISRFDNKVKIKGLSKLTEITLEDYKTISKSYGNCSQWLHDESAKINSPLPKPDAIQEEINIMREWIRRLKKAQQNKVAKKKL
ncbi:MAG: hypothetical protein EU981_01955 [Candidatus Liberibacter ctenarytainae]|uniref:Protein CR006 P-loop domain-containing protein n=1 Tax=Candidatus Liberibacter ctenarytainae TaxID=2020335 RepID=A0A937AEF0_9HYPH|nr:hypothetical protein [Candidatus Liberibacter ctenarytainae]